MPEPEDAAPTEVADETIDVLAGFVTRLGRKWRDPDRLLDLVDAELVGIDGLLHELGERSRSEQMNVPDLIRQDAGRLPLFEAATLSHAAVQLAGPSWGRGVPEHACYLFAGLATRAISVVREIAILLDHGYPLAAKSRWRTLSELLVVARVIMMGDRYTATRYMEHRWIILAKERSKLHKTDWVGSSPTPEVMKGRLVRRFGAEYAGLYGWAARVSARELGIKKPKWEDLQTLAGVDENVRRVNDAHHAVHGADALGLLGTIDVHLGAFHAGATSQGVLEVAHETIRLFRQTLAAIFEMCTKYTDARKPLILWGTVEVHLFNLEVTLTRQMISADGHARAHYLTAMGAWWSDVTESPQQHDVVN